jgi:hypothetical protein
LIDYTLTLIRQSTGVTFSRVRRRELFGVARIASGDLV